MQIISILILLIGSCCVYAQQAKHLVAGRAQGTTYAIQYYAEKNLLEKAGIDSILGVIDQSMSLYQEGSLINRFNRADVTSIDLDAHMYHVLRKSFEVHQRSKGLFDITVEPLVRLWGFGNKQVREAPLARQIDSALALVGMSKLRLHKHRLLKKEPRLSIDLNGIAQGYTVDVLAAYLEEQGIENYLVELGGEIRTKGYKDGHMPFTIAIERPLGVESADFILELSDVAVTTSGNYRKAFDYQGKKIHHHIDPHTGYPVQNEVASVTVVAATALEADAYDNVFMAMSAQEGLRLAEQLNGVEVYIIYKKGEAFEEAFSEGFARYIKK